MGGQILGVLRVRGGEPCARRLGGDDPYPAVQRALLPTPDSPRLRLDSSATTMAGFDWRMTLEAPRRPLDRIGWAASVPGFEINDLGFSSRQEMLDGGVRVSYREIMPGQIFGVTPSAPPPSTITATTC